MLNWRGHNFCAQKSRMPMAGLVYFAFLKRSNAILLIIAFLIQCKLECLGITHSCWTIIITVTHYHSKKEWSLILKSVQSKLFIHISQVLTFTTTGGSRQENFANFWLEELFSYFGQVIFTCRKFYNINTSFLWCNTVNDKITLKITSGDWALDWLLLRLC